MEFIFSLTPFILDWLDLVVRWIHIIVGIAWIGTSFYFIALDLGLRRGNDLPEGVHGEEWQVDDEETLMPWNQLSNGNHRQHQDGHGENQDV